MVSIMALAHRTAEAIAGVRDAGAGRQPQSHWRSTTHGHADRHPPIDRDRFFIGGEWVEPDGHRHDRRDRVDDRAGDGHGSRGNAAGRRPGGAPRRAARSRPGSHGAARARARAAAPRSSLRCSASAREELAALIAREVGMPIGLAQMIQAGLPTMDFGAIARAGRRASRGRSRSATRSSCASRSASSAAITPWNYPLHQLCGEGGAGARRGLHGGGQAQRGDAAQRVRARRDPRAGRRCPPACSTSSPASGPRSARRSPRTPSVDMVSFTGSTAAGGGSARWPPPDRQAGRARAGRQVGQRDPRRRRPAGRRRRRPGAADHRRRPRLRPHHTARSARR